ncbi:hypothetical protein [Mucilaginibacter panaciglaebae]|uniref:Uncharacterized protein n=1 Tax=Mucilaginibacter panaciglaebae TaxID=502331 RepID=A0ABP7WQU2_9SPHI
MAARSGFQAASIMALSLLSTGVIAAVYYVLATVVWKLLFIKKQFLKVFVIIVAALPVYTVIDTIAERFVLNTCGDCMVVLAKNQQSRVIYITKLISNH